MPHLGACRRDGVSRVGGWLCTSTAGEVPLLTRPEAAAVGALDTNPSTMSRDAPLHAALRHHIRTPTTTPCVKIPQTLTDLMLLGAPVRERIRPLTAPAADAVAKAERAR